MTSTAFKVGGVCLAFMILGYEVALFVHRAAVERVASLRDHPDTVYITVPPLTCPRVDTPPGVDTASAAGGTSQMTEGVPGQLKLSPHSPAVEAMRERTRRVESFRFNPNEADVATLQRLGFTLKQAQAIDNYRMKGGRFRRKEDFAKSFVVADSVYRRLESYIDIPLLDINEADSAAFDALPGIGGYFAARMVKYRSELGGYSYKEQLMDIWHFDRQKYDGLSDLITCSPPRDSLRLWTAPADSLRLHPYVRSWQTARSIVLFRQTMPRSEWSPEGLARAGVLPDSIAAKLSRCAIEVPR